MSRVGKAPIVVPNGVTVTIDGRTVAVTGPKGSLEREIPGEITVRQDEGSLLVERPDDERQNRAFHGLTRALVNNMVVGVTEGYRKQLEIVGIDKQMVGQVAANIRSIRKPEPYKGKGVRYAGEHVARKAGKAAK